MISYRITKYNPEKRDENGSYMDKTEWTSISDIGKEKYGNLKFDEYKKNESAYIDAIRIILLKKRIDTVKVNSLEKNNFEERIDEYRNDGFLKDFSNTDCDKLIILEENVDLGFWEFDNIIRLILRELVWMNLENTGIKVIFGYDYYMYVECEELKFSTIIEIEKLGLFVEPNIRRR